MAPPKAPDDQRPKHGRIVRLKHWAKRTCPDKNGCPPKLIDIIRNRDGAGGGC